MCLDSAHYGGKSHADRVTDVAVHGPCFGVRIEAWRENMKRCVHQLVTGETHT